MPVEPSVLCPPGPGTHPQRPDHPRCVRRSERPGYHTRSRPIPRPGATLHFFLFFFSRFHIHFYHFSHSETPPNPFILPSDPTLSGTVTFEDGSQKQVDFCIQATGYQVDFPFFDQGIEPSSESDPLKFHLPKFLPPQPLSPHLDTQKVYNTTSLWPANSSHSHLPYLPLTLSIAPNQTRHRKPRHPHQP